VVLDGTLAAAGYEDQLFDTCIDGFLGGILDQWLVHHRQHLLRICLGRRQEAGAQTCYREYSLSDFFFHS
jgi:hypothetical protein